MNAKEVIDWFRMQPNDAEGGYFASTYTSTIKIPGKDLPGFPSVQEERPICSAIYYLLEAGGFSAMHKVTGDMLYHFYSGDPVQMLLLYPEQFPNRYEVFIFSNDLTYGSPPMKVIPGGTWIGSRLVNGGGYALMGVSMAPGFDPADYTIGSRVELIEQYTEVKDLIIELTRG